MAVTDVVKGQTIVTHTINADNFKHCLMTFGEKMTEAEIDDVFDEFDYDDDGLILTKSVVDMFVAGGMDEKEDDKKKKEEEEKKKKEAEAKAAAEVIRNEHNRGRGPSWFDIWNCKFVIVRLDKEVTNVVICSLNFRPLPPATEETVAKRRKRRRKPPSKCVNCVRILSICY